MARKKFDIDDFFNESDEESLARARKSIANLPKPGPDTRSQADKERDAAFKAESAGWAKSRAEHTKRAMDEKIKNMSEEDKAFYRNRAWQRTGISKPRGY